MIVNKKRLKSRRRKKGQTTVEYILVMTVVAAMVFLFQNVFSGQFGGFLRSQKGVVEQRAIYGNPLQTGSGQYQHYYLNNGKNVVVQ